MSTQNDEDEAAKIQVMMERLTDSFKKLCLENMEKLGETGITFWTGLVPEMFAAHAAHLAECDGWKVVSVWPSAAAFGHVAILFRRALS
jgi:hypothetical protein